MKSLILRKTRLAFGLTALMPAVFVGSIGLAQTTKTSDVKEVKTMEKFEVTGSYLPQSATAPVVPVSILSSKDIEKTGVTSNLLEVLKKTMPQLAGNANLGTNNANIGSGSTNGGSQIALRNLPTLVLINGRRAAISPVAGRGGYEFVDVNLIPLAAVERVEVVTEGASALYGSDAVSGVVNVVMKTDYQGLEIGGGYGFSPNSGNWAERHGHLVGGVSNGKTSITISGDYYRSDPLFQYERDFSKTIYGTATFAGVISIGGNYYLLNPKLNAPPSGHVPISTLVSQGVYSGPYTSTTIQKFFNLANAVTLLGRNERKSTTAAFNHKISDNLEAFGDFIYSSTQNFSQLNGQPFNAALSAMDPTNPTDVAIVGRNRFVDKPRKYYFNTDAIRGVAGLKGKIGEDWSWEAAANYGDSRQSTENPNLIDTNARIAAVSSGTVKLTSYNNTEAAQNSILGTAFVNYLSKLSTYDFLVRGKLFDLPAGSVNTATSIQLQRSSLSVSSDRNSNADSFGWDSGVAITPFSKGRSVWSEVLELQVPLIGKQQKIPFITQLDFDGAVRHDDYSDVNKKSTVPKYSLRWQPFGDEFVIRTAYSKSFTAPGLYDLYGPTSFGFTSTLTIPAYNSSGVATGATATGQANSRTGANKNLEPATSDNFNVGFVYSPKMFKGLTFEADYFHVNRYKIQGTVGSSTILRSVERYGSASPYAGQVKISSGGTSNAYFDSGKSITASGQVSSAGLDQVYVSDQTINLGGQKVDGFDVSARYDKNVEQLGRFDIGTKISIYNHYKIQGLPTDNYDEYSNLVSGNFNTLPDWRSYTTIGFTRNKISFQLAHIYVPSLYDISGVEGVNTHVDDYHQFDLQGSYVFGSRIKSLSGLSFTFGVENIFNKFGPASPSNTQANIDTGLYGALGRKIYGSFVYKF